jgi:hypothetical protein
MKNHREQILRANAILRAVEYGVRSHSDALRLIDKAQGRHQARHLRELVRKDTESRFEVASHVRVIRPGAQLWEN